MTELTPKQRAQARREAILNKRGDRLAKLTSSARGDEAAALYADDSAPSSKRSTPAPPESRPSPSAQPSLAPPTGRSSTSSRNSPDPQQAAEWGAEQQQMFIQALTNSFGGPGAGGSGARGFDSPQLSLPAADPGSAPGPFGTGPDGEDPLAQLFASLGGAPGAGMENNPFFAAAQQRQQQMQQQAAQPVGKTRLQKMLPLLHIISTIALLAFFVIRLEPTLHSARPASPFANPWWERWASLGRRAGDEWGVQAAPLFYAFVTVQVVLHSIRFAVEPPRAPSGLLGMAAANLPPPFPTIIFTGLKYISMAGSVLDDLSLLLFGVGVVVWVSGLQR